MSINLYQPYKKIAFTGLSPALQNVQTAAKESLSEQPPVSENYLPALFALSTPYSAGQEGGQIKVDPRLLLVSHIGNIYSINDNVPDNIEGLSLSQIKGIVRNGELTDKAVDARGNKRRGGDWLAEANMYNLMVRGDTAWDSNHNGRIELRNSQGVNESGTFTKAIDILPHLAKMKVNCIYLNPINQVGEINRKGDAGSPYAIRDFYELNSDMDDPQLETPVDKEFKAFVDAAHKHDMRVMLDFVFRVVSYDNVLLIDKPQWAYWHQASDPNKKVNNQKTPDKETMEAAMNSAYVKKFGREPENKIVQRKSPSSDSPGELNTITWKAAGLTPREIITELREKFDVEPVQAGPPDLNDPQVWSDVTFLRTKEPVGDNEDIKELWQYLENVIPYYQQTYGIDAARIDMAHDLHPDLEKCIMNKARETDPDISFLAEDFGSNYGAYWGGDGRKEEVNRLFNATCGNLHDSYHWDVSPTDHKKHEFHYVNQWAFDKARWSDGLSCASGETHDSPRVALKNGILRSKVAYARHSFYPKMFPAIIGGFELGEKEPKKRNNDVPSILFSYYPLKSWTNPAEKHGANTNYGNKEKVADVNIADYISRVAGIRNKYLDILTDPHSESFLPIDTGDSPIYAYARVQMTPDKQGRRNPKALLIAQNMDCNYEQTGLINKETMRELLKKLKPGNNVDDMNFKLHDELTDTTYERNSSKDLNIKLKRGQTHIFSVIPE